MNATYIGTLVSALALVVIAGNASASEALEAVDAGEGLALDSTEGTTAVKIRIVEGTGSSCIGWGDGNVCWGIHWGPGLTETCTGLWNGSRCTGVQT